MGSAFAQRAGVDARAHARAAEHPGPHSVALTSLAVSLLIVFFFASVAGCRRSMPAVAPDAKPSHVDGTLNGTVRGSEASIPVDGRTVEVVNVTTGERHRATTSHTGAFSLTLTPGKYRVELALREGEAVLQQPGVIDLNTTAVGSQADFVLAAPRVSRPRAPAHRTDDGLGSPIA